MKATVYFQTLESVVTKMEASYTVSTLIINTILHWFILRAYVGLETIIIIMEAQIATLLNFTKFHLVSEIRSPVFTNFHVFSYETRNICYFEHENEVRNRKKGISNRKTK